MPPVAANQRPGTQRHRPRAAWPRGARGGGSEGCHEPSAGSGFQASLGPAGTEAVPKGRPLSCECRTPFLAGTIEGRIAVARARALARLCGIMSNLTDYTDRAESALTRLQQLKEGL